MGTKIIKILLLEYKIDKKPDYIKLGNKVDKIIEKNIPNGKYIVRALSSYDHPKLSLNKLLKIRT